MSSTVALPSFYQTEKDKSIVSDWKCPEFKVSGVFSSHMVLQREKPIKIWGFSQSIGSTVKASFMGETATAKVGEDNRFMITLSPRPYNPEPEILTVSDDIGHEVVYEDVLVGDVWLICGQSNAELHLSPCMSLTPSIEFDENDNFRLFYQAQGIAAQNLSHIADPSPDVIRADWIWKRPDEKASLSFSALGWYFAKEITKHVGVPLGIIMMAAGGAALRELMPAELNYELGYRNGANVREGGYYDTLIHPFIPLPFKAMIFFQGESEGCWKEVADRFDTDMLAFFTFLRAKFDQNFPIYNIQLSDYPRNCERFFPFIDITRTKQFDALSIIPDMTLTVDMDLGADEDYNDWAHSPRKLEFAERVASLALAKEYGVGSLQNVVSPRPIFASLSEDKSEIKISFTDVGTGLIVSGQDPRMSVGLEVCGFTVGPYENRIAAKATITSRSEVTVKVPEGADTSCVGYAFSIRVSRESSDLYNGNNLPCTAFLIKIN